MRRYEVTLQRKPTQNAAQNARARREVVIADSEFAAKREALEMNDNARYFTATSVRTL